ncbi:MAG: site-specific integrase [Planctomycetaceae bacterium]|nr:site-specific integrase [Planctomycetaceae bacterium]
MKYKPPSRVTWDDFCERFETEVLPSQAEKTTNLTITVFNAVRRIIDPKMLVALNAEQISLMQSKLRKAGCAEASIQAYMRQLKAALRWGHRQGMLNSVPNIEMPKKVNTMKGRPIAAEEFERMLSNVADGLLNVKRSRRDQKRKQRATVDDAVVESWQHLLRGLWWSGLRLGEALILHWTDDRNLVIDLSGRRPMIRIRAHAQKSRKEERLPIAPEFAEFLFQTPEDERTGFVFNPIPRKKQSGRLKVEWASAAISAMGEQAIVKVAENDKGKVKFASAHDLRRAFGFRWSNRVMPPILQQMMRHASIQTTMEFYVGRDADAAADAIWDSVVDTFVDTTPQTKKATPLPTSHSVATERV